MEMARVPGMGSECCVIRLDDPTVQPGTAVSMGPDEPLEVLDGWGEIPDPWRSLTVAALAWLHDTWPSHDSVFTFWHIGRGSDMVEVEFMVGGVDVADEMAEAFMALIAEHLGPTIGTPVG